MQLFPDPPLTIEPAQDRPEPVVWIHRLLIVPSLVPTAEPIRDVSFRLGLNIIRTADRPPDETRVIGHSVGKTLLTRLIRYCLGETHFAVEPVRRRIAGLLPKSHVIAVVNVEGKTWVVVRPLQDSPATSSWVMAGEDWQAALTRPDGSLAFAEFSQLVERATLAEVPDIALPNAGRPMRWLDLLGWLARDHDCRYRVYNEWREPDADSGTGKLHRDDASFLLRLIMGLVDPNERPLIEAHRTLLADQEQTKTRIGRLNRFIENTFPLLRTRLGLTEEDCGDDQQFVGGLFATRAKEKVTAQQRSLRQLSAEMKTGSNVDALYEDSVKAAQARAIAERDLERVAGLRDHAAIELKQIEQSSLADFYRAFAPTLNCPAQQCPLRPSKASVERTDPNRDARLKDLKEQLQVLEADLPRLKHQMAQLQHAEDEARTRFKDEQRRLNERMRGISRSIGRWKVLSEQTSEYEEKLSELIKAQGKETKLSKAYGESIKELDAARTKLANRRTRLSEFFDWTLKQLLGPNATGSIDIDARGLHPHPDDSVAANGAALSTLATVIALDLSCLTASACGLGHHSRFLIHDGPREAEMESVLFHAIFQLAATIESAFSNDRLPAFQYIVTTSSPVPPEFAGDDFTRLILDARSATDHLMRIRF
jgi:hypothetical protein